MRTAWQELSYGLRLFFKNPTFTVAAVLAMALGIATSTMIFSMVNAVLLRPLPYTNPDEVIIVGPGSKRGTPKTAGCRRLK